MSSCGPPHLPFESDGWTTIGKSLLFPIYRFDREALVQWRYERLSVGEAAILLGVNVSTIDRWTREGKLEPLRDMEGKQRWFAWRDLLQLLQ